MIIFDTETTGFVNPEGAGIAKQPRIIEFAFVIVDDKTYKIKSEYSQLIYPEMKISEEITKITGLTDKDLQGKPTFIEALCDIEGLWLGQRRVLAHNFAFDHQMLINELTRIGRQFAFPYPPEQVCSVQETEHLNGKRMKLTELYEYVFEKKLEQTHRALDDVKALAEIVKKLKL
jgi:DNA polymerase III epsilon subunit-like protein